MKVHRRSTPQAHGFSQKSARFRRRDAGRKSRPALERLECRLTPTVSWTGLGASPYWDDPGNWDTGAVPGPADDVVIDDGLANAFTVVVRGMESAKTVECLASLNVDVNSHLSLAAPSSIAGNLDLSQGSTIDGPGSLELSGQLQWQTEARLGLVGTTTISATGGISAPINSVMYLDAGTLLNEGSVTLSDDSVYVAPAASIDNAGTWTLKDSGLYGPSSFVNEGTLATDAGNGSSDVLMPILNTGDIQHIAGSLSLGAQGVSSSTDRDLVASPTTELSLFGDWLLPRDVSVGSLTFSNNGGAPTIVEGSLSATGTILVRSSTTVRVEGTFDAAGVELVDASRLLLDGLSSITGDSTLYSFSQLGESGDLAIGGVLSMGPQSHLAGALVTLTPSGSLVPPSGDEAHVDAVTLRNEGMEILSGGAIDLGPGSTIDNAGSWTLRNGGINYGAGFTNEPDATMATADDSIGAYINTRVVNLGTIDHRAGDLLLGASASSTETSIVTAQGASLELTGDWTVSGDISTGSLTFTNYSGVPTIVDGSISATDSVVVRPSYTTVRVSGTFDAAGVNLVYGSKLLLDGPSTITGDSTLDTFTQLGESGELSIGGVLGMSPESHLAGALVTLTPSGSLVLPSGGEAHVDAVTLRNDGTEVFSGGWIALGPGSTIENAGSWTMRNSGIEAGAGFMNEPGATLATADDSIGAYVNTRVVNLGTIDHRAGDLLLGASASSTETSIVTAQGASLELAGDWTVEGDISTGSLTFTNYSGVPTIVDGSISATDSVVVRPSSTTVRVSGTFDAAGVDLVYGSKLLLDGPSTITGDSTLDTFTQLGETGELSIGGVLGMSPESHLAGALVTLTPSGSLVLPSGGEAHVDAVTLRNEGTEILSGGAIDLGPGSTIDNAGSWTLRNGGIEAGAGFINGPGATLATADDSIGAYVNTRVVNLGTIDHRAGDLLLGASASSTETSIVTAQGASLELAGDWTVEGDISTGSLTFTNYSGVPTIVDGSISATDSVVVRPSYTTVRVSGTFDAAGVNLVYGSKLLLDGPSSLTGDSTLDTFTQLGETGDLSIGGVLSMGPQSHLAGALVTLTPSGSLVPPSGDEAHVDAVTLRNEGTEVFSGGWIALGPGSTIENAGSWTMRNSGIEAGAGFINEPGATLATADDSIGAALDTRVVNLGTIEVQVGTLNVDTLTGDVQTDAGSLVAQIGGLTPGTGFGQIVSGNVSLSSTLQVTLNQGFVPQLGDQFTIIDNQGVNAINGTFTGLAEGATVWAGAYGFTVSYLGGTGGHSVTLTVSAVQGTPTLVIAPTTTTSQVQAFIASAAPAGGSIVLEASGNAAISTAIQAVNGITPSGALTIGLDLGGATFTTDTHIAAPPGVTVVIINGTLIGGSPALIVDSGAVVLDAVTAMNATNAPTILVNGGTLKVRNSTIQESTGYTQAAIRITGGTVDLGTAADPGGNTININGTGDWVYNTGGDAVAAVGTTFTTNGVPLAASSISGTVFADFNDDGQVDFGEQGIANVMIALDGTDILGNAVHNVYSTLADGAYVFPGLLPGYYTITESQPAGYTQGINSVGTGGGTASDDQFDLYLAAGLDALNYNYAERPVATGAVHAGQTAGIGFWNNKNGQALIKALNGGGTQGTATQLGDWLAATFPHMFGALSGSNNLAGKDNADIASFLQSRFVMKDQKLDAQVLATALAVYVTDATLNPTLVGTQYGFIIAGNGVGTATFSVGANGEAFGVANNTTMTVMDLLLAADALAVNGVLYNGNTTMRTKANNVFGAINQAGSI